MRRLAGQRRSGHGNAAFSPDRLPSFIACGCAVVAAAIASMLIWARRQEGVMRYYLGDVNYAIYYFCALLAAAVMAGWLAKRCVHVWQSLLYGLLTCV